MAISHPDLPFDTDRMEFTFFVAAFSAFIPDKIKQDPTRH